MRRWQSALAVAGLALLVATTAYAQGKGVRGGLDADRDGVITREEATAAAAAAAARLDTDGDGTISVQEFTESRLVWFDRLDRNGDGVIDQTERPQRRGGHRGAPGQPR